MELTVAFIELVAASLMMFGALPLLKECCGTPERVKITAKDWGKRQ